MALPIPAVRAAKAAGCGDAHETHATPTKNWTGCCVTQNAGPDTNRPDVACVARPVPCPRPPYVAPAKTKSMASVTTSVRLAMGGITNDDETTLASAAPCARPAFLILGLAGVNGRRTTNPGRWGSWKCMGKPAKLRIALRKIESYKIT